MVDENSSETLDLQTNPNEEVTDGPDTSQQGETAAPPAAQEKETAPAGEQQAEQTPKQPETNGEVSSPGVDKRISQLTGQKRELANQLRQQQAIIDELRGSVQTLQTGFGNQRQPQQQPVSMEQQQAIAQLKQMMGMDKFDGLADELKSLKEQNQQLSKQNQERLFDQEEQRIDATIKEKGLGDPNDIKDQIEDFINSNKFLAQSKTQPGVFEAALDMMMARGMFGDLGQRAAAKEMVQKQNEAIKGRSERGTQASAAKGKVDPKKGVQATTADLIDQLGGLDSIDMS